MSDANALQKIETLFQQNKKQEALKEYKFIMETAGQRHDLWVNYASFLFRCGQYEEAVAISQKSISIKPTAEGYHNLGCAYTNLRKTNEAMEAFKMAIHFNYNLVQSHNGLSNLYEVTEQYVRAIDHQQIATTLAPNNIDYWVALARLRRKAGRIKEALSALRTARKIKPDSIEMWQVYSHVFGALNDFDTNNTLIEELTTAFNNPYVKPDDLSIVVRAIFLQQPVIKRMLDQLADYRIRDFKDLLQDKSINWNVLKMDLFVNMFVKLTALGETTEKLCTAMRFHFLESLDEKTQTFAYVRELLPFSAALACQCFINEYIFWESKEEKKLIDVLRKKIENSLKDVSAFEITVYASYCPLFELKNAKEIQEQFKSENSLKSLLQIQIIEPLEEEEIKKSLKTLTPIDNEISKLVKEQYEANPYPRWVRAANIGRRSFKDLLLYLFPFMDDSYFNGINKEEPQVLIAGCGTGKQPIETSSQLVGAHITAIDISAASLAYAVRKTKESNITNIEYGIADILKIGDLNKKFDIVYCGGVLHHMQDPMAGWGALNEVLKPGGYMMVALYSEIARKPVVAARSYIKEKGYKTDIDGIRTCREEIKLMEAHHPVKKVSNWIDFFTTSAFRDLVFHVQEHRFTALDLKKSIAELGLEFLGFQFVDKSILSKYIAAHPDDPYGRNLDYWDDYERENPALFEAMYQFWLRKPD